MKLGKTRKVEIYDSSFYTAEGLAILDSPRIVVPLIISLVQPKSVVDVGCGRGSWLCVFQECGVERILGIDAASVNPDWLLIPKECFRSMDLALPFQLDEQFDLAVCLEVAEHLPDHAAVSLISSLTALAPVVLFSAAVPFQGGVHHVNEQWPEYWRELFERESYCMLDLIRKEIWKDPRIKYWYRQNLFLYVRNDLMVSRPKFAEAAHLADDLRLIHPAILEAHYGLWPLVKNLPRSAWQAGRNRMRRLLRRG